MSGAGPPHHKPEAVLQHQDRVASAGGARKVPAIFFRPLIFEHLSGHDPLHLALSRSSSFSHFASSAFISP